MKIRFKYTKGEWRTDSVSKKKVVVMALDAGPLLAGEGTAINVSKLEDAVAGVAAQIRRVSGWKAVYMVDAFEIEEVPEQDPKEEVALELMDAPSVNGSIEFIIHGTVVDDRFGYELRTRINNDVVTIPGYCTDESGSRAKLYGLKHAFEYAFSRENSGLDIVIWVRDFESYLRLAVEKGLIWLNDGWKITGGLPCKNMDIIKDIVPYIFDAKMIGRKITIRAYKGGSTNE